MPFEVCSTSSSWFHDTMVPVAVNALPLLCVGTAGWVRSSLALPPTPVNVPGLVSVPVVVPVVVSVEVPVVPLLLVPIVVSVLPVDPDVVPVFWAIAGSAISAAAAARERTTCLMSFYLLFLCCVRPVS